MIKVNGQQHVGLESLSVLELLERSGFKPERVAVERNGEIVPRLIRKRQTRRRRQNRNSPLCRRRLSHAEQI